MHPNQGRGIAPQSTGVARLCRNNSEAIKKPASARSMCGEDPLSHQTGADSAEVPYKSKRPGAGKHGIISEQG